ncbi:MAG: hypothetical protein K0R27_191 [Xanthobacteraceae bacterium]|nr:hypothetical protein [Xanthobacteraceae bacterium]
MRFMFIVLSSQMTPPTPELMEAIGKLSEQEIKAGRLIDTGGLVPLPMGGAQVQLKGGQIRTIDGPYVEAKEMIGGFAIFELKNMEEAIASAQNFMQLHKELMPGWDGTCEIRLMAENCADTHEAQRSAVA